MKGLKFRKRHMCTLWTTYTFQCFYSECWDVVMNNLDESDNIIDAIIAEYILNNNLKFRYYV